MGLSRKAKTPRKTEAQCRPTCLDTLAMLQSDNPRGQPLGFSPRVCLESLEIVAERSAFSDQPDEHWHRRGVPS